MNDFELIPLIEIALRAAISAGHEVLQVYNSNDFEVETKDDNTPVTRADYNANFVIIEQLQKTKIPIISEETTKTDYAIRNKWRKVWIIDPLDGTKEFVNRNGEFTINIALIVDNLPIVGVIYSPTNDTLYFGISYDKSYKLTNASLKIGNFSYKNICQQATQLPIATEGNHPYTILNSRSHQHKSTDSYINTLLDIHPNAVIKTMGSSIKLCLVAEGVANIYPRFTPTCEWDIAAGQAIIEGAGGEVVDFDTSLSLSYNKEDFLNPRFVAQIYSQKVKILHDNCKPLSL